MVNASLSVVVTTHKRDYLLSEALRSLSLQDTPLDDVVVVDDGGPGSARQIVESFGSRFRYYWQANQGMQSARNRGTSHAEGSWIAFLDDDDLWERDRHTLLRTLMETDEVDVIAGNLRKFGSDWASPDDLYKELDHTAPAFWNGFVRPARASVSVLGTFPTTRLFPVHPFWPSTLALRKQLLAQIGGWDTELRSVKAEDIDFVFRAVKYGRLGVIWLPTVRYRCHSGNDSADTFSVLLGRIHVWERILRREDVDHLERQAILDALVHGLKSAQWSAYSKSDYRMVNEVSRKIGWARMSVAERTRSVVAQLRSALGQLVVFS